MSTKFEKLAKLAEGPETITPIPEWPKLPAFFKERFPDKVAEIDAWDAKALEFFKQASIIRG